MHRVIGCAEARTQLGQGSGSGALLTRPFLTLRNNQTPLIKRGISSIRYLIAIVRDAQHGACATPDPSVNDIVCLSRGM